MSTFKSIRTGLEVKCFNRCFTFLVVLDGKEINEVTRQFLINWKTFKETNRRKTTKV